MTHSDLKMDAKLTHLESRFLKKKAIFHWFIQTINTVSPLSEFLSTIPEFLIEQLEVEKVAIFIQKSRGFKLQKATFKKKDWNIPSSSKEFFIKTGEKVLTSHKTLQIEQYFFVPLFRIEIKKNHEKGEHLPVGFLIIESLNSKKNLEDSIEDFEQIIITLLSNLAHSEERFLKRKFLESDLTSIRQTVWDKKLILKYQYRYDRIVGGRAPLMAKVFDALEKIIPTDHSLILEGESGTGKELIAQTVHYNGPLAEKPFLAINCGALHPQILESQIFGHLRGAFTGADTDQEGLLAQVDGGTLFLDELNEMPLDLQTKFLRVLQEGEFRPLGSPKPKKVHLRVIAASQKDLKELTLKGLFREDLFYRINVVSLAIPPLRKRKKDIPLLVQHFLKEISNRTGKPKKLFTKQVKEIFHEAPWPGNVRQLENVIEISAALVPGNRIDIKHLPTDLQGFEKSIQPLPYEIAKKTFLNDYLENLMNHTRGKVIEAAQIAGIKRESFYRMIKKNLNKQPISPTKPSNKQNLN
jgi:DNA-binding NtrC family response regulator